MILEELKSYQLLCAKDNILAAQVQQVYKIVYETINGISKSYDNFTMHDMNHGLRVAHYMEELAFGIDEKSEQRANDFNGLELALIILSAILHDIGMCIRDCDREDIKNNKIKYLETLTYEGVLTVKGSEEEAIKEIVRLTHAARIYDFIDFDIDGQNITKILMVNGSYSYADDVAQICRAHGEEYAYLKTLRQYATKGKYDYNLQYIAALLRIADYLDLDKQRTPMLWYATMGIKGFSREEWEKHFIIQNEKKLIQYLDGKSQIYFDGKSSNAKIHRKYLRYYDELTKELENADSLLNTIDAKPKYRLNISTKILDRVQTEGFQYSDLRLNLDYSAITELLMGKNIYGDCKLGLRELIQNSIDACKIMNEVGGNDDSPVPTIYIKYSEKNNYVKIKDLGIGMTLDVVRNHFLNIGKSYYKSHEYLFNDFDYKPIGQYGIGFLACFLLSNNVIVKTKHFKSNVVYQIELEKSSEYVVTNKEETPLFMGTEITLDYKDFFNVFKNIDNLKSFIETYFNTEIPIYLQNDDSKEKGELIPNTSEEKIASAIKRSKIKKFDEVECSIYSDKVKGKLYFDTIKHKQGGIIEDAQDSTCYLYNKDENRFNIVKSIPDGYYRYIDYALISDDDYQRICNTTKDHERRTKSILALAKEQGKTCRLFAKGEEFFSQGYYFNGANEMISNYKLIMENSNLPFFNCMFYTYERPYVFFCQNKYIRLQTGVFSGNVDYVYIFRNQEEISGYFYNKDILVRDFRYICCYLPSVPKYLFCTVNYLGNDIKLDVSRNEVIEGYDSIRKEINKVMLQDYYNKESNPCIKTFIQKMLELNND